MIASIDTIDKLANIIVLVPPEKYPLQIRKMGSNKLA